jgi:hypothetical protein
MDADSWVCHAESHFWCRELLSAALQGMMMMMINIIIAISKVIRIPIQHLLLYQQRNETMLCYIL